MGKATPTYNTYVTLHIYFLKLKYFQQNIFFKLKYFLAKHYFSRIEFSPTNIIWGEMSLEGKCRTPVPLYVLNNKEIYFCN